MGNSSQRVVGINEGRPAWSEAAFTVLEGIASKYGATIVYSQLAEDVQRHTGLVTRASQRNWIGKVLSDVVHRCHAAGLPALTALVVHKDDGQVGIGYDEVLSVGGTAPIDDQLEREVHAAHARLECYRRWSDEVPVGAEPMLTPQMQRYAQRRRSSTAANEPRPVCPSCFMEMPAIGICLQCDPVE